MKRDTHFRAPHRARRKFALACALGLCAMLVVLIARQGRVAAEVGPPSGQLQAEVEAVLSGMGDRVASTSTAYGEFTYTEWRDQSLPANPLNPQHYLTSAAIDWAMDGAKFAETARLNFADGESVTQLRRADGETLLAYIPVQLADQAAGGVARQAALTKVSPDGYDAFLHWGMWPPGLALLDLEPRYNPAVRSLGERIREAAPRLAGVEDFNGFRCYRLEATAVRRDAKLAEGSVQVTFTKTWWISVDGGNTPVGEETTEVNDYSFDPPGNAVKSTRSLLVRGNFLRPSSGALVPQELTLNVHRTYVDGSEKELRRASLKAVSLHVNEPVPTDKLQISLPSDLQVRRLGEGPCQASQ